MKPAIFTVLLFLFNGSAQAQAVAELPPGRYETKTKAAQTKWEKGDLVLLDDSRYKLSGSGETGEYKFSAAAQRLFFTSGPLKSAFTKVTTANGKPVVILPAEENAGIGITAEVWARKE